MMQQRILSITLEPQFQKRLQLLKINQFNQDRQAKNLIIVSQSSHLLQKQAIPQRILIRLTRIVSWFYHILVNIEEHISSQYVMVMVWMESLYPNM